MRCLTMADALRARGDQCTFICRPHTGHLLDLIAQRGHTALALPVLPPEPCCAADEGPAHARWLGTHWHTDATETCRLLGTNRADWLVVDHYALDHRWEHLVRPHCLHLMAIDDLADRRHDCDLLLDQNLGRSAGDYANLVPQDARVLAGPRFAMLRPEFNQSRHLSLARRRTPERQQLLITMGGVDKDNVTGQVLNVLADSQSFEHLAITVVLGPQAPWRQAVQDQARHMPWPTRVRIGVPDMAALMAQSDLAIGAAGGTAWERCCLGLPSVVLVLAANQQAGAMALQRTGAAVAVENIRQIGPALQQLLAEDGIDRLRHMSEAAARVTDGQGLATVLAELTRPHD